MERFDTFPQCAECLFSLAKEFPAMDELDDPDLQSELEPSAARILQHAEERGLTSPQAANLILRAVSRITSKEDPYASLGTWVRSSHCVARKASSTGQEPRSH